MSYDKFRKKIVQAQRKNFPNNHTSPAFIREMVIVVDTRKNPNVISEANLAFVAITRSNINYLMNKNEKLAQKL